jgi:3-isopropylmalate/(R)-2-methylmalate dehydratase large subunit
MVVELHGTPPAGVSAKDLALAILAEIGFDGGTGYVIEYRGKAIRGLSMEGRMTLCNLSIEAGARAGLVAADQTTIDYLVGRPKAPQGEAWTQAVQQWSELHSDEGAHFDRTYNIDVSQLQPRVSYGSRPDMNASINACIPQPSDEHYAAALHYMQLEPGAPLTGTPIDEVFIGSCTNSRIEDLREAANLFRGRKVKPGLRALVVPGSKQVQRQALKEGLDEIFLDAGCEWREPGCSMCIAMNGDMVAPGRAVVSTSNRNFPGRQGPGARTFLASPMTAAAAAVTGTLCDPRELKS